MSRTKENNYIYRINSTTISIKTTLMDKSVEVVTEPKPKETLRVTKVKVYSKH